MNHEHLQTDKTVKLKLFGELKGHPGGGAAEVFWLFLYKDRKVRGNKGFFLGKTCEPLVVRGTTSFYNNKLQILHVGEGAAWNVQM